MDHIAKLRQIVDTLTFYYHHVTVERNQYPTTIGIPLNFLGINRKWIMSYMGTLYAILRSEFDKSAGFCSFNVSEAAEPIPMLYCSFLQHLDQKNWEDPKECAVYASFFPKYYPVKQEDWEEQLVVDYYKAKHDHELQRSMFSETAWARLKREAFLGAVISPLDKRVR